MKKTIVCLLLCSLQAWSQAAIQRTIHSSYADYLAYLHKTGGISFAEAYIHLSSVTEMETPLLEQCLEEIYLGAPSQSTCLSAVKALTSRPLNPARREVLLSFLMKMEKIPSQNRIFFRSLKQGLLRTHPDLAKTFHLPANQEKQNTGFVQELELSAWKKALVKRFPLEEVALLVNGKKVSSLKTWQAPAGSFQWVLITNSHVPFVRLGSFSQFAAESLKSLEPLADVDCGQLQAGDLQKFGLLRVEIFGGKNCVVSSSATSVAAANPHLGRSAEMTQIESSSSRHWIWASLIVVGAGVAASLQNKKVTVGMPGFH